MSLKVSKLDRDGDITLWMQQLYSVALFVTVYRVSLALDDTQIRLCHFDLTICRIDSIHLIIKFTVINLSDKISDNSLPNQAVTNNSDVTEKISKMFFLTIFFLNRTKTRQ